MCTYTCTHTIMNMDVPWRILRLQILKVQVHSRRHMVIGRVTPSEVFKVDTSKNNLHVHAW